jgi:hypothetical protein
MKKHDEMYPLTEAEAPPACPHGALMEVSMRDGEIALVCWRCGTYWCTGLKDRDASHLISHKRLLRAVDARYRVAA